MFFDPLDNFNLLLLGSAKYEKQEYLSENGNGLAKNTRLKLLEESKSALLACFELADEAIIKPSQLIVGEYGYFFVYSAFSCFPYVIMLQ